MSRPIRFQGAGLIYHVMARGNNKMRIFLDDLDYARFLAILAEARRRFELDLWLFCVMPNHHHLVFRTRKPNLSRAVRYVNGTYAQWWNRRHGRVGHAFQGRFKAQIVEACTYLLRLCRYVLMNPVRSSLVAHPCDWKWSSYEALARASSTTVDVESLLRAIDPDATLARIGLLEYVHAYADDEMAAFVRSDRRVIGSAAFAERLAPRARRASREVPLRERRIGAAPLARVLADAFERGAGLHGGVIDAHAASYPLQDIADCAGLCVRTVQRIIEGRVGGNVRPGTATVRSTDLTPGGVRSTDLTPVESDLQT